MQFSPNTSVWCHTGLKAGDSSAKEAPARRFAATMTAALMAVHLD